MSFKTTDKRRRVSLAPPKQLVVSSDADLRALRAQGMTLPRDNRGKLTASASMKQTISSRDLESSIKKFNKENAAVQAQMRRSAAVQKLASGDMLMALPKTREPMGSMLSKGIPWQVGDPKERMTIRQWARAFYTTHNLVSLCIDIYTRFPIQGMELTCKDPELVKFHEQQFFEMLDYENFLLDFGREYHTVGEVNALGNFNETLGVWDAEEVINPDDLEVRFSPFQEDWNYKLKPPEYLKALRDDTDTMWEYELLRREYPELLEAAQRDEGLAVSNVLLKRAINKMTPWDAYGTPHMMRAFELLLMEQSLNAAQDAVADRLYAPLILAKLGMQDMGDGEPPWIPDRDELDNFRNDLNFALAADFRLLVHHFGIEIENVFGREAMPRLGDDYDRIERKVLQVWGIGEALVSGGSNQAAYASTALNAEFATQLMSTFQKVVKRHYRERALIVAEAQEHFDYEVSGKFRVPIMEEVLERDEEGVEYIRKRPKLLIPDLNFATINLRDQDMERQFLLTLKQAGVPISDQALMVNIPFEFDEELEKVKKEKKTKVIAEAQNNKETYEALITLGLPVPPELMQVMAPPVPPMMQNVPGGGLPPGALPPGSTGEGDLAGAMGGGMPPPGMPAPGGPPAAPGMVPMGPGQSIPMADISSATPTPNLTPNLMQPEMPSFMEPSVGTPEVGPDESAPTAPPMFLPRNQISQRPEISDQERRRQSRTGSAEDRFVKVSDKDAEGNDIPGTERLLPKRLRDRKWGSQLREARMATAPSHVGKRSLLEEETVKASVERRAWADFMRPSDSLSIEATFEFDGEEADEDH